VREDLLDEHLSLLAVVFGILFVAELPDKTTRRSPPATITRWVVRRPY
jgi:hypothetical protein